MKELKLAMDVHGGGFAFMILEDDTRVGRILEGVLTVGHGFTVTPEGGRGPWRVAFAPESVVFWDAIQAAIDFATQRRA